MCTRFTPSALPVQIGISAVLHSQTCHSGEGNDQTPCPKRAGSTGYLCKSSLGTSLPWEMCPWVSDLLGARCSGSAAPHGSSPGAVARQAVLSAQHPSSPLDVPASPTTQCKALGCTATHGKVLPHPMLHPLSPLDLTPAARGTTADAPHHLIEYSHPNVSPHLSSGHAPCPCAVPSSPCPRSHAAPQQGPGPQLQLHPPGWLAAAPAPHCSGCLPAQHKGSVGPTHPEPAASWRAHRLKYPRRFPQAAQPFQDSLRAGRRQRPEPARLMRSAWDPHLLAIEQGAALGTEEAHISCSTKEGRGMSTAEQSSVGAPGCRALPHTVTPAPSLHQLSQGSFDRGWGIKGTRGIKSAEGHSADGLRLPLERVLERGWKRQSW